MTNQFTLNRRRLTLALAITAPVAVAAGIGLGELQWRSEGAAISLPEMCVTFTSTPNGETTVSRGSCDSGEMAEI